MSCRKPLPLTANTATCHSRSCRSHPPTRAAVSMSTGLNELAESFTIAGRLAALACPLPSRRICMRLSREHAALPCRQIRRIGEVPVRVVELSGRRRASRPVDRKTSREKGCILYEEALAFRAFAYRRIAVRYSTACRRRRARVAGVHRAANCAGTSFCRPSRRRFWLTRSASVMPSKSPSCHRHNSRRRLMPHSAPSGMAATNPAWCCRARFHRMDQQNILLSLDSVPFDKTMQRLCRKREAVPSAPSGQASIPCSSGK